MSAGKGDTYRKVDPNKWDTNYSAIRWKSLSKIKLDKSKDLSKLSKQQKQIESGGAVVQISAKPPVK